MRQVLHDDSSAPVLAEVVNDESQVRMQAFLRSWLCPGAGLAHLGWPGLALLTWWSIVVFLFCTGAFIARASVTTGAAAGVMLVVGLAMWTVEQAGVFLFKVHPPRLQWLFRFYLMWTVLMSASFLVMLVVLAVRYAETILKMYGL